MKQFIICVIFISSALLLNAQTKTLIKTTDEIVDKSTIDNIIEKRIGIVRYELISIDTDAILNEKAVLEIFGYRLTVYEKKLKIRGLKNYSWFAKSANDESSFILTVLNDDIQGMLKSPQGMFIIETINSHIIIRQVEQSLYGTCVNDFNDKLLQKQPLKINNQINDVNSKNNPPVPCKLRIIALYTQAAEDGASNIVNTIQLANDQMNMAFMNSDINEEVELVYIGKTNYTESNTSTTSGAVNATEDVTNFRTPFDGFIDGVQTLRNTYDADICVLIEDIVQGSNWWESACGVAASVKSSSQLGFCVVDWECAVDNITYAHEIGHLIGCRHDEFADPNNVPFSFGHGFTNPVEGFRTIMAFNSACLDVGATCDREVHFSNPNINFGGNPTGTTGTNDNARVIEQQFDNVMSFRQPNSLVNVDSDDLTLIPIDEGNIVSLNNINTINNVVVLTEKSLQFTAGNSIKLTPGFTVQREANFKAVIAEVTTCGELDELDSDFDIAGEGDNGFDRKVNNIAITYFPNPVIDNLTLTIKGVAVQEEILIEVYSFKGQLLQQRIIVVNDDIIIEQVSLGNLSNGTFFITITMGSKIKTFKIIKL
jgi:hypothetical protein